MIDSLAAHAKRAETGSAAIDWFVFLLVFLLILSLIGGGIWLQWELWHPTVIVQQGCGKIT